MVSNTKQRVNPAEKVRIKSDMIAGIADPQTLSQLLLEWYDAGHRDLPFRRNKDPYQIWVSEIMAQQTRMEALLPYYERFIKKFPSLPELAAAKEDDLMKVWQGLGYYSRARKLLECARVCMEKYEGNLPETYQELAALPGIGPYTAGAVASIAFEQQVPAVDGNVIRVFSRLTWLEQSVTPLKTQKQIRSRMQEVIPNRAGDFNQALMELGALICLPKNPRCSQCPLQSLCLAARKPDPSQVPLKDPKKARKVERKQLYIWVNAQSGRIHFVKRPPGGLLGGLYGFDEEMPRLQQWSASDPQGIEAWIQEQMHQNLEEQPDLPVESIRLEPFRHVFTHKEWQMDATLLIWNDLAADCSEHNPPHLSHSGQAKSRENIDEKMAGFWLLDEQAEKIAVPSAFQPFWKQTCSILQKRFPQKFSFPDSL